MAVKDMIKDTKEAMGISYSQQDMEDITMDITIKEDQDTTMMTSTISIIRDHNISIMVLHLTDQGLFTNHIEEAIGTEISNLNLFKY
jgi:hypothetical protein